MNYRESIEESKRDRLYDCHSKLQDKVNELYGLFEGLELSQDEEFEKVFATINYELTQFYEELYFS